MSSPVYYVPYFRSSFRHQIVQLSAIPSTPTHPSGSARRTIVFFCIKLDVIWPCPVELCLERCVLQGEVRLAKIMCSQQLARCTREAIPANQVATKPNTLMIFDCFVIGIAEAEAVRVESVFMVDHLGMVALPQDLVRGLDLVGAVLAGSDVLSSVVADPDSNMLPEAWLTLCTRNGVSTYQSCLWPGSGAYGTDTSFSK